MTTWPPEDVSASRKNLEETQRRFLSLWKNEISVVEHDVIDYSAQDSVTNSLKELLILKASGHIEFSINQCILATLLEHRDSPFYKQVERSLLRASNPKPAQIKHKMDPLGPVIKQQLEEFMETVQEYVGIPLKQQGKPSDLLGQLVKERNTIAHGKHTAIAENKSLLYSKVALHVSDYICFIVGTEILKLDLSNICSETTSHWNYCFCAGLES